MSDADFVASRKIVAMIDANSIASPEPVAMIDEYNRTRARSTIANVRSVALFVRYVVLDVRNVLSEAGEAVFSDRSVAMRDQHRSSKLDSVAMCDHEPRTSASSVAIVVREAFAFGRLERRCPSRDKTLVHFNRSRRHHAATSVRSRQCGSHRDRSGGRS